MMPHALCASHGFPTCDITRCVGILRRHPTSAWVREALSHSGQALRFFDESGVGEPFLILGEPFLILEGGYT